VCIEVKKLVKTVNNLPWLPKPSEASLYITDELPSKAQCATADGFVFRGDQLLLTRLRERDWDLPGGMIDPKETPAEATIREVWEETYARVSIVELIGIQETKVFCPKPLGYEWPYPISTQVFYLCELVELCPFKINSESKERKFFSPREVRLVPTMENCDLLYEESLRRVRLRGSD
jgi:8-oxo-dGTP pyrophosphatase MutT (NUDIX family)